MIDKNSLTTLGVVIAPLVLGIDGRLKQPSDWSQRWLCWVMPLLTVSYVRNLGAAGHS